MIPGIHLNTFVGLAAFLWAIVLILSGISLRMDYFYPYSIVTGILVIILILFDKKLWKLQILYPWFVQYPDISGTWKGIIVSSWRENNTNSENKKIEAILLIHQTYSSINIQLITKESKSNLLSGNFIINESENIKVAGIYNNIPNLMVRDRSPIHYGGLLLEIGDHDKNHLYGEYWTDRETRGTLSFNKRINTHIDNFDDALRHFNNY